MSDITREVFRKILGPTYRDCDMYITYHKDPKRNCSTKGKIEPTWECICEECPMKNTDERTWNSWTL